MSKQPQDLLEDMIAGKGSAVASTYYIEIQKLCLALPGDVTSSFHSCPTPATKQAGRYTGAVCTRAM